MSGRDKPIPHPRNGLDIARLRVAVRERLSQLGDALREVRFVDDGVSRPEPFEELLFRDDLTVSLQQELQGFEVAPSKTQGNAVAGDDAFAQIDRMCADDKAGGQVGASSRLRDEKTTPDSSTAGR